MSARARSPRFGWRSGPTTRDLRSCSASFGGDRRRSAAPLGVSIGRQTIQLRCGARSRRQALGPFNRAENDASETGPLANEFCGDNRAISVRWPRDPPIAKPNTRSGDPNVSEPWIFLLTSATTVRNQQVSSNKLRYKIYILVTSSTWYKTSQTFLF